MKILEVTFTLESGGAERFTVDLCNELSTNNDVTLLTLKDDKVDKEKRCFYKFDLSDRVKYVNLGLSDGFSIKSLIKIYLAIRNIRPDIVHLNGGNVPKFCVLAIMFLSGKIKFVQTIHNDLKNGYDKGINRLLYNTFGVSGRYTCVALSEKNYNDFRSFYPKLSVSYIVNGRSAMAKTDNFDSVSLEVSRYRKDHDTKLFLHVARCHEQKNQDLLVDAFNIICKEFNVSLIIIGNGFDSSKGIELKNRACENIHFLGTRKNISDYYLCSDIFVLSSIFEGMPISLIEASLAGLPCISTPVCGSVDLIKDGVNGIISSDFTLDAYVLALRETIKSYDVLKENSERMKNCSPYTMVECAKKYNSLFLKILK